MDSVLVVPVVLADGQALNQINRNFVKGRGAAGLLARLRTGSRLRFEIF